MTLNTPLGVSFFKKRKPLNHSHDLVLLYPSYLIADYDRAQFTIAPCVWPSIFKSNLVAIHSPTSRKTTQAHKRPVAIIAGTIGAFIVVLTALSLIFYFLHRRRSKAKTSTPSTPSTTALGTSSSTLGVLHDKPELNGTPAYAELLAIEEEKRLAEISGTPILGQEMDSEDSAINELPVPQVYELCAEDVKELPSHEAAASELPSLEDSKETSWVPASDILSRVVKKPSPLEIMSAAETLSPGSIGDGLVSPLSPADRQGRRIFVSGKEEGKRHDKVFYS